jgi:peptidoglycan-associated lipoprotein
MFREQVRTVLCASAMAFPGVAGCHHGEAPPPATPVDVAVVTPAPAPVAVQAQTPTPTVVHVARDILEACAISDVPSGKAPLFAFDSAALSDDDQRLLAEVATCLNTGPLAGRSLTLIGRADPRGTAAYNMGLGERRAGRVGGYLEKHGMDAGKLSSSSRGALDATGNDENGWKHDRRVDVDLVKDAAEVALSSP